MSGDLAAFIAARLDEEKPADTCGCLDTNHWPSCVPQPWADRKRREIAADRALIAEYERALAKAPGNTPLINTLIRLMRARAAVWSDHPDYRQEWKP